VASLKSLRMKILLLGVSFAESVATVSRVKEEVMQGRLSQIDGRDLVRCLMLEEKCNVDVYTVSLESAAVYRRERHFNGDFNHRNFVRDVNNWFGFCQFEQIILDYFWMPPGCWERQHWKRSFFQKTLVGFAADNLLVNISGDGAKCGVIYLPFSFYCFKEVAVAWDKLRPFYSVYYVRKGDLGEHLLWYATQFINGSDMLNVFGKQIDQEEEYCSFELCRMQEMLAVDDSVTIEQLRKIAIELERFRDIRFIALSRL